MNLKYFFGGMAMVIGIILVILTAAAAPSSGKTYDIVLDSEITSTSSEVTGLIDLYRHTTSRDTVRVHISGPGGEVDTVFLIINAIKASKAHTVMIVEAPAYSGDAYLATVGDELIMRPYSYLMFHTSSGYGIDCTKELGEDRNVSNAEHCASFMKAHLYEVDKFLNNISFLTDAEKFAVTTGHDVYVTAEDFNIRKALSKKKI